MPESFVTGNAPCSLFSIFLVARCSFVKRFMSDIRRFDAAVIVRIESCRLRHRIRGRKNKLFLSCTCAQSIALASENNQH